MNLFTNIGWILTKYITIPIWVIAGIGYLVYKKYNAS